MTDRALEGVKVIDLTHHIAGPYCTKLLADFGADVIKVERPGGDPARRMPPFFHDETDADKSLLFLYLNTNKQGITLNLKSLQGQAMLKELVRDAGMLVENFSPRVLPSLGLHYEELRQINPSLVMTSISNFGQTGPYRDYRAADIVEYALGGLMYIFGGYDAPPLKHALHQAQFRAGTNSASASLMAMYHQRLTDEGQHVDVSIQECVASGLRDVVDNYTYTGAVRRREPNHRGDLTRIREVSDGYILPNPGITARLDWSVVADFLEAPELNDERFNTASARYANPEALGEMTGYMAGLSGKTLLERNRHYPKFRSLLARRGGVFLFVGAVIPNPLFDVVGIAAGSISYPIKKFLTVVFIGKAIKSTTIAYACFWGIESVERWVG